MRKVHLLLSMIIMAFHGTGQVNVQTGSAQQNFPLISYSDAKSGLTLGVALNYSSGSGLMVNEIASDIGAGWNLDAGGMISRVQVGQPDDQPEYFSGYRTGNTSSTNYPAGYLYNSDQGKGCNQGTRYYPVFKDPTVYKEHNRVMSDLEQDKFVFRFNGRYGTFVIGKDWKAYMLGDSRIKIEIFTADLSALRVRTTISKFIITTEDGIKYTFQDLGLSELCRYKNSRFANGTWTPLTGNPSTDPHALNSYWGYDFGVTEKAFVVSSWFLTEIENSNTGAKISFQYDEVSHDIVSSKYVTHNKDLNKSFMNGFINLGEQLFEALSDPVNATNYSWNLTLLDKLYSGATSLTYIRSKMRTKRLKKIILPANAEINFNYSSVGRADLPGEHALTRIEYKINSSLLKAFDLEHGYFFKNTIRPYTFVFSSFESKFARLCLLKVNKRGTSEDNMTEPPYQFTYYTGSTGGNTDDIVPARNYLSQDHWGYYNGNNAGLPLAEDHDFLANKGLYYNTVLPKFHNAKSGYAKNGLLKSVTYPTGGSIQYFYTQNIPGSNILPAPNPQLAGGVSVSQTIMYDGENHAKDIITDYSYVKQNLSSSRWGDETPIYYAVSQTRYDEKWGRKKYKYPGVEYPELKSSIDMGKVFAKALVGTLVSFGIQAAIQLLPASMIPVVNAVMFVISIVQLIISMTSTYKFSQFVLSNQNTIMANPLGGFYSRVEVRTNSPTGNNGKTIYEFTDYSSYPIIVPNLQWPYVQDTRIVAWAYGLPKRVTVYDRDNNMVRETLNDYSTIQEKIANNNNLNCYCATKIKWSLAGNKWNDQDNTLWQNQIPSYLLGGMMTGIATRPYLQYTGRTDLASITEKTYKQGNLYFTNVTNILTDPASLLQRGKIIEQDGSTMTIEVAFYPKDYTITTGGIGKLKLNNAIHTPVSTEKWMLVINAKPDLPAGFYLLDATATDYSVYTFNGRQEVRPWKTYRLKTRVPIPIATIGSFDPGVLLRQPQYYKMLSEMYYDANGNLIQTRTDDNSYVSFINDYSDRLVSATVLNAEHSEVAFAGFESDGKGNWTYNQAFVKNNGIAGLKCFHLGLDPSLSQTSTITRSGLNTGKTYTITYWQKPFSGLVLLNGIVGTQLYTGPNGWTLWSHEVTGVSSVTITASQSALLDELRLHPKGALMNSFSFREGIGKITESDANNRMLFYEYDGLGRLRIMRDQQRNIFKTYEYNYKR